MVQVTDPRDAGIVPPPTDAGSKSDCEQLIEQLKRLQDVAKMLGDFLKEAQSVTNAIDELKKHVETELQTIEKALAQCRSSIATLNSNLTANRQDIQSLEEAQESAGKRIDVIGDRSEKMELLLRELTAKVDKLSQQED